MTPNITKFLAEIKTRLKANNGKIPAPLYFEIGKLCGLKCKDVVEAKREHFADQLKPSVAAKAPAAKKVKAPKVDPVKKGKDAARVRAARKQADEPAELTKAQKKAAKNADESTGIVEQTETAFVWIATPEEIVSDIKHDTDYVVDIGE